MTGNRSNTDNVSTDKFGWRNLIKKVGSLVGGGFVLGSAATEQARAAPSYFNIEYESAQEVTELNDQPHWDNVVEDFNCTAWVEGEVAGGGVYLTSYASASLECYMARDESSDTADRYALHQSGDQEVSIEANGDTTTEIIPATVREPKASFDQSARAKTVMDWDTFQNGEAVASFSFSVYSQYWLYTPHFSFSKSDF